MANRTYNGRYYSPVDPMALMHINDGIDPDNERLKIAQIAMMSKWWCEGMPPHEMGERLHVPHGFVTRSLNSLKEAWVTSLKEQNILRSEELAKINNLEAEAWNAWHKSCEDRIITRMAVEGSRIDDDGTVVPIPKSQVVTREARNGNPVYLEMIFRCIDRRIKLLGLDMPLKVQSDVSIRFIAQQIAESEGLDPEEVLSEAQRVFDQIMRPRLSGK